MKKSRFTKKMLSMILSLLFVFTLLIGSIVYFSVKNLLVNQAHATNRNAILTYEEEIGNFQYELEYVSRIITNDASVIESIESRDRTILEDMMNKHLLNTTADVVGMFDDYGTNLFLNEGYKDYVDPSFNDLITKTLDGDFVKEVIQGIDGNYLVIHTSPIRNDKYEVIGAMFIGFIINNDEMFEKITERYGNEFITFNEEDILSGTIRDITTDETLYDRLNEGLAVDFTSLNKTEERHFRNDQLEINQQEYNTSYSLIDVDYGSPLVIISLVNQKVFLNLIINIILQMVGLLIILSVLIFVFLWFYLKKHVTIPLSEIISAATNIKNGNMNFDMEVYRTRDEFEELTLAFREMVLDTRMKSNAIKRLSRGDFSHVPLDEKGHTDELSMNINHLQKTVESIAESAISTTNQIIDGKLDTKVDNLQFQGAYSEIMNGMHEMVISYAGHFSKIPIMVMTLDVNRKIIYANEHTRKYSTDSKGLDINDFIKKNNGDTFKYFDEALLLGKTQDVSIEGTIALRNNQFSRLITSPLKNKEDVITGCLVIIIDETEIKTIEKRLKKQNDFQNKKVHSLLQNIQKLSHGDFTLSFDDYAFDEDTKEINQTFSLIEEALIMSIMMIQEYISVITTSLESLKNGKLDFDISADFIGDFLPIKESLVEINSSMKSFAHSILETSNHLVTGMTTQVKDSNILLEDTTSEASALEEISATVTQVVSQVKDNSSIIDEIAAHAKDNRENALISDHRMKKLEDSMSDISKSTEEIQEILKLINDISFQTNILSLNAAVEAARAGQHGKGFAVIAEDVRNLALKSSQAALETEEMIQKVIGHVKEGVLNVSETTSSMKNIFNGAKKVNKLSKGIKETSDEQIVAISQIEKSLLQISEIVNRTKLSADHSQTNANNLLHDTNNLIQISRHYSVDGATSEENHPRTPEIVLNILDEESTESEEIVINLDDDQF